MFGGEKDNTIFNDTWYYRFDTHEWKKLHQGKHQNTGLPWLLVFGIMRCTYQQRKAQEKSSIMMCGS